MNIFFILILFSNYGASIDSLWASLNRITPNVGFSAIKINLDAKSSGMGNITHPDISFSPLENPALTPENLKFTLSHRNHLLGTSFNQGIFRWNNEHTFLSLTLWDFGSEGMELHTDTPGAPEMTYDAYNFIVATTYARKFYHYSIGLNLKILNERIMHASYSVPALDFGLIYRMDKMTFSFVLLNLGPDYLGFISMRLPKTLKIGAYSRYNNIKFGLEGVKSIDSKPQLRMGINYLKNIISLRLGGIINAGSEYLSAGMGIHLQRFDIDYAVMPFTNDLGITQIFSVIIK